MKFQRFKQAKKELKLHAFKLGMELKKSFDRDEEQGTVVPERENDEQAKTDDPI